VKKSIGNKSDFVVDQTATHVFHTDEGHNEEAQKHDLTRHDDGKLYNLKIIQRSPLKYIIHPPLSTFSPYTPL
jgi:hypothetical protein